MREAHNRMRGAYDRGAVLRLANCTDRREIYLFRYEALLLEHYLEKSKDD